MAQFNFSQLRDKPASRAAFGALLLYVLGLQGCATAERSWDVTKSASGKASGATRTASGKAWDATREASGKAKDFVLRTDRPDNQIGFEYQWQIMTLDTRQIASEDLYKGRASLDQDGLAGGAACAVVQAKNQSIDILDSLGAPASSAVLEADGFFVSQVGNLQTHRQCSPTSVSSPAQLSIVTDKKLLVGVPMHGRALVSVGERTFDSSGLYFKFWVDSLDLNSGLIAGQFEFMGQDQNNADNRETLLINDGRFSIKL